MKYLSVCSGIEAATVAWSPLGWKAEAFSEIEKFPSAVLAHHYPNIPNYGDMTKFKEWKNANISVLVGGTPCQSFSVAGLRKGLDDPRGNLMLTYLAIAAKYRPKWLVWENVPGVLSSNRGRDFGTFLGGLAEIGYGFSYRVLDAQYFGLAQRRKRVFVVGCIGDWRASAAVLFERHSLSGDSTPSRDKKERPSTNTGEGVEVNSGEIVCDFNDSVVGALDTECSLSKQAHQSLNSDHYTACEREVMGTITASMFNSLGTRDVEEGAVVAFSTYNQTIELRGISQTLTSRSDMDNASCVLSPPSVSAGISREERGLEVRRLSPIECERLQGFPDDYTKIPYRNKDVENCPLGPRYKAIGNSMAVPVMRWIGERIVVVDKIINDVAHPPSNINQEALT